MNNLWQSCSKSTAFVNKELAQSLSLITKPVQMIPGWSLSQSKQNFIIPPPVFQERRFFPCEAMRGKDLNDYFPTFSIAHTIWPLRWISLSVRERSQMPPGLWPSPGAYRSRQTFFVDMSETELWKWQHKQGRGWHVSLSLSLWIQEMSRF